MVSLSLSLKNQKDGEKKDNYNREIRKISYLYCAECPI